jgi:heme/copper-type cytochrome/quinol oxidase subunit 4
MATRAHYSTRSSAHSGIPVPTLVGFVLLVAILAAALWLVGTMMSDELGSTVTGWLRNL